MLETIAVAWCEAQEAEPHRLAGLEHRHPREQVLRTAQRLSVHLRDHVAARQSLHACRTVSVDIAHENRAFRNFKLLDFSRAQVSRHHADPSANDPAILDDRVHDAAHEVHRNGESDAFDAGLPAGNRAVEADELAARIDECAAGVAEIDRGVGLDEILENRDAELAAAGRADDALCHRLPEPERIADREHGLADPQPVGTPERHDRQRPEPDLQDGEVGVAVDADERRGGGATVLQLDLDLGSAGDHVEVRDDVAADVVDDPGSEAALDALAVVRPDVAE